MAIPGPYPYPFYGYPEPFLAGIQSIQRDWGTHPSIVRILTTDTLAVITAPGYLDTQKEQLEKINFGKFDWVPSDFVAIAYAGGKGFFNVDPLVNMNFSPLTAGSSLSAVVNVTSAQILAMSATPVLIAPAPGVGNIIIGTGPIQFVYNYVAPAYAAGGALGLEYGAVALRGGPAASTTLPGATFDGYVASTAFTLAPVSTGAIAGLSNLGVYLSNDTAAFTTGAGNLTVTYPYTVIPAA